MSLSQEWEHSQPFSKKGVQYAKEASGHKSDRYIWRYVKPSQQSLAEAIDELDAWPGQNTRRSPPLPISVGLSRFGFPATLTRDFLPRTKAKSKRADREYCRRILQLS
jgi:hypothetical protein